MNLSLGVVFPSGKDDTPQGCVSKQSRVPVILDDPCCRWLPSTWSIGCPRGTSSGGVGGREPLPAKSKWPSSRSGRSGLDGADDSTCWMMAALSQWIAWRDALVNVQADTLLRWHRPGFRLFLALEVFANNSVATAAARRSAPALGHRGQRLGRKASGGDRSIRGYAPARRIGLRGRIQF